MTWAAWLIGPMLYSLYFLHVGSIFMIFQIKGNSQLVQMKKPFMCSVVLEGECAKVFSSTCYLQSTAVLENLQYSPTINYWASIVGTLLILETNDKWRGMHISIHPIPFPYVLKNWNLCPFVYAVKEYMR